MRLRQIRPEDRAVIDQWYVERGQFPPTLDIAGEFGFVVEGKELLACGWILPVSGTKICLFEYFQTSPKVSQILQGRAFVFLSRGLRELAIQSGFCAIIAITDESRRVLQKFYLREGGKPKKSEVFIFNLRGA